MSSKMTPAERVKFLQETRVGVLAVDSPGRGPLAVPVWYGWSINEEIIVWTQCDSRKGRLLSDAGRCSFVVQSEKPPYAYVSIEGSIVADLHPTRDEVRSIVSRYVTPEEVESNIGEDLGGSMIVRITPAAWATADYSKE